MNLISVLRVLKSRIKKRTEEDFIKERKEVCNICEHNTKNINKISFKQKILDLLSTILTFIMTGEFNEDKSACNLCSCTLTYKIPEEFEDCLGGKWKSIYIPNGRKNTSK